MALSKDEVIKIASNFIKLIWKKLDVRQAYLFGSFIGAWHQNEDNLLKLLEVDFTF